MFNLQKKYVMTYWLKNQSKLFSEPEKTIVRLEMLEYVIHMVIEQKYEIESIVQYEEK